MTPKLVSILIVTYNADKFIEKTIRSCLNQTYNKFEILILDNNSTDKTVQVIKKFKSPKIKLFKNKENIGPYHGLNFLINKAKGEYIAILDHDDLWLPQKLQEQVNFLSKHSDEIACGTRTNIYYESKKILISDPKPKRVKYVNHISLMFRNQNHYYQPEYKLADEHFEKIVLKGNTRKITCLNKILAIHRIRSDRNNLSKNRFNFSPKDLQQHFEINGLNPSSFITLIAIFVSKFFPSKIEWSIIKFAKRNSTTIKIEDFNKKYPNLIN